jgi:hypothetical protein
MLKLSSSKWLGIGAIVVGVLWLGASAFMLTQELFTRRIRSGMDLMMTGLFMLVMLLAVFSIHFGARVLEAPTTYRIKRASGYLVTLLAIYAAPTISSQYLDGSDDHLARDGWILFLTVAAIGIHMITCRTIVRREGIPTLGYREFIGKTAIFLVAWQIWMLGYPLVDRYAPKDPDFPRLAETPWEFVGTLGAIFLAWGFYRIAVRYVERGMPAKPKVADRVLRAFGML